MTHMTFDQFVLLLFVAPLALLILMLCYMMYKDINHTYKS